MTLEQLPLSALRNLLIEEVKRFIIGLDKGSTEDLQQMKLRLRKIFDLISTKEKQESMPIQWGENSAKLSHTSHSLNPMPKANSDTQ